MSTSNPAPDRPLERTFGRYRVLDELGRGGQARVLLAEDPSLNRKVALKILLGERMASERNRKRFRREAEIASRLEHPGICTVYEAGEMDGSPYLAMRYVEGESLADKISSRRDSSVDGDPPSAPPPVSDCVEWIEKCARALQVAHEAGLVHRDIKPGNIMVGPDGEPVVLDFGLARDQDSKHMTLTQTGEFMGTPAYMSPEQLQGPGDAVDGRADVYSLGATLYELLTLQRLYETPNWEGLYKLILSGDTPDPRRLNPLIPRDLSRVLEKALEKSREHRYATAGELADDLARVREGEPVTAGDIGPVRRARRWLRRNTAAAAAMAAVLLVLATAGGTYLAIAGPWADPDPAPVQPPVDATALGNAMAAMRAVLPIDAFDATDATPIRREYERLADTLSMQEAADLRRWVVGSLLEWTAEFPRESTHSWGDRDRSLAGRALWNLLAALEPAQFEEPEVVGEPLAALGYDGGWIAGASGRARELGTEGALPVFTVQTDDYVFHSDLLDPEIVHGIADRLQRVHSEGYLEFLRAEPEAKRVQVADAQKVVVRVFADPADLTAWGAPPGSNGAFHRATGELGVLAPESETHSGQWEALDQTLGVQGLNAYLCEVDGAAEVPPWLSEGMGEFFGGARCDGEALEVGSNEARLRILRQERGRERSLRKLLNMKRKDFYRNGPVNAAQAWSFVYFLLQESEKEEWRRLPARFLEAASHPEAIRRSDRLVESLAGVDLEELESAWHLWLEELRAPPDGRRQR